MSDKSSELKLRKSIKDEHELKLNSSLLFTVNYLVPMKHNNYCNKTSDKFGLLLNTFHLPK